MFVLKSLFIIKVSFMNHIEFYVTHERNVLLRHSGMKQPLIINSFRPKCISLPLNPKIPVKVRTPSCAYLCTHTHTTKIMAGNFFKRNAYLVSQSQMKLSLMSSLPRLYSSTLSSMISAVIPDS